MTALVQVSASAFRNLRRLEKYLGQRGITGQPVLSPDGLQSGVVVGGAVLTARPNLPCVMTAQGAVPVTDVTDDLTQLGLQAAWLGLPTAQALGWRPLEARDAAVGQHLAQLEHLSCAALLGLGLLLGLAVVVLACLYWQESAPFRDAQLASLRASPQGTDPLMGVRELSAEVRSQVNARLLRLGLGFTALMAAGCAVGAVVIEVAGQATTRVLTAWRLGTN